MASERAMEAAGVFWYEWDTPPSRRKRPDLVRRGTASETSGRRLMLADLLDRFAAEAVRDVVRLIKGRININLAECARDDRTNHAKAFAMTRVGELRKVLVQMGVRCGEGLQREADDGE